MPEPGRDRLLTYDDYAAFPDDGHRYQLLDGELIVMPLVSTWHQEVSLQLAIRLLAHVQENDLGQMLHAPLDVTLDDHNVVQPDIFFISEKRAGTLQGDVYRVRSIAGYEEPFRPAAFPGFEFTLSVVALPDGR